MITPMEAITAQDFPFVESLPRREKSKFAKLWDSFNEIRALQAKEGLLIPDAVASDLLDVSRVRIAELCDTGKLKRVMWHGRRFVTENSFCEYARSERKSGRPQKTIDACATNPLTAFSVAKSFAK